MIALHDGSSGYHVRWGDELRFAERLPALNAVVCVRIGGDPSIGIYSQS